MNSPPAGDHPLQGDDHHPHQPPVERGADGAGVPGAPCSACHTGRNVDLLPSEVAGYRSIPGHPRWQLAPREMAWEGKTIGEICRQLKDRSRNGGRDLAQLHEHMAKDDLVAYGWHPGTGRAPAPGTQERLGELIQAWIDSGAAWPWWRPAGARNAPVSVFRCRPRSARNRPRSPPPAPHSGPSASDAGRHRRHAPSRTGRAWRSAVWGGGGAPGGGARTAVVAIGWSGSTKESSRTTGATSALILATIWGGVLTGANTPYQDDTSKPGRPDSAMVGRSGA